MLKRHNQLRNTFLRILDLLIAFSAWELAYLLRFHIIDWPPAIEIPLHQEYLKAAVVVVILTLMVFTLSGVYRHQHSLRLRVEGWLVIRGAGGVFILTLVAAFFYRGFSYSRIHMLYFLVCFVLMLGLTRYLVRRMMNYIHSRGAFLERVLVVGDGSQADFLIERLKELKPIGIHLSGSISLEEQSSENPDSKFLGSLEQLPQIIQQQRIDQVFISLSLKEQHRLEELKDLLSEQWVDVRIVPDLGSFRTLHTDVESFAGMPLVTLVQSPMTGWNQVLKRVLDLAGAILALILFSPLMLLIAFLVKITSPGPILYRQQRMGLDGKTFFTLKFRSMRQDAEKQTGAVWATENDTRRTTLGVYLRRFNLDELPQLFNVLNGEMSLVGPRPERPVLIEEFKSKIPNYMLRHKVKAGITGWAQINGWRGNTSLEKRIEHDLYYIERWSVWLDLKILLLTVFKGFVDPNAY